MCTMKVTSKITVEAFISADEFIGKTEARHEAIFLKPENSTERAREEDSFDSSKGNETCSMCQAKDR